MLKWLKHQLLILWMRRMASKTKVVNLSQAPVKRIALWQFGGVGDMLLATPVIEALSKQFPDAAIQIWCSNPPFAQFLLRFRRVQSVHEFKVYDFDMRTMMQADVRQHWRGIRNDMASFQPDLIVNLHVPAMLDWWAAEWLMLRALKPEYALGFDPVFMGESSVFHVSVNAKQRDNTHYTTLYQQLLAKAGIPCETNTLFPIQDDEHVAMQSLLGRLDIQSHQTWVCMHIGGRRLKVEHKMWPIASFAALAERLLASGVQPVLIGVDSERDMGDALCQLVPQVKSVIGQTSIGEMAALIRLSSGFVGHDSGPFHVAVAVGTPAVAICGRPDAEPEYLKYDKDSVAVLTADNPEAIAMDDVLKHMMAVLHV